MYGRILYSGQLSTTSATAVYTVPTFTTCKIATGSLCNTSGSPVAVSVQLLQSGQTADGTHAVVSFTLNAGDSWALRDWLGGAMLGTGESIVVTAGTANAICVVITGAESS